MEKTIKYTEIESITYKFNTIDIRRALTKTFNIPSGESSELELYEESSEPQYAELIVTFRKEGL